MTRIFTIGLESQQNGEGAYLLVQVAHRNGKGAVRAALAEAAQRGGSWKLAHKAERRTGVAIPEGEILGASGPFSFSLEAE
jgi:hypothetical protein